MAYRYKYQVIQALDDKIGCDLRRLVENYLGPYRYKYQVIQTLDGKLGLNLRRLVEDYLGSDSRFLRLQLQADLARCIDARQYIYRSWILPYC
jgi:hypothetical protein